MTALWFLLVAVFALGGVAVLWRLATIVLEVVREPLPPSLQRATHRSPAPATPARPVRVSGRVDDAAHEAVALFTRGREAAVDARPDGHEVAGHRTAVKLRTTDAVRPTASPTEPTRVADEPTYAPSWADLLAETLREAESVRT